MPGVPGAGGWSGRREGRDPVARSGAGAVRRVRVPDPGSPGSRGSPGREGSAVASDPVALRGGVDRGRRRRGKYLGVEVLRRPDGTRVGHMAVYLGRPSWIFAIVDDETSVGTFDVEVVDATGARHPAGVLTIDAGGGGGLVLPSGLGRVTAIVLIPRDGGDPLEARLPST